MYAIFRLLMVRGSKKERYDKGEKLWVNFSMKVYGDGEIRTTLGMDVPKGLGEMPEFGVIFKSAEGGKLYGVFLLFSGDIKVVLSKIGKECKKTGKDMHEYVENCFSIQESR